RLVRQTLAWMDMVEAFLRHQGCFMEARQNELQLAGIAVDIADGEDSRHRAFELRRIYGNEVLMEIEPPFGDRAELHGEPEERQQGIGGEVEGAFIAFDVGG